MYCLTKTTSESLHIYILRAYMRRLLNAMTLLLEVAANWRYIPPSWKHCATLGCLKWVNVQLVVVKLYTLTPFMTQGEDTAFCMCVLWCVSPKLDALPCAPPPSPSFSLCRLSNFPFVAAVGNFKFWHFWKQWPDPALPSSIAHSIMFLLTHLLSSSSNPNSLSALCRAQLPHQVALWCSPLYMRVPIYLEA